MLYEFRNSKTRNSNYEQAFVKCMYMFTQSPCKRDFTKNLQNVGSCDTVL